MAKFFLTSFFIVFQNFAFVSTHPLYVSITDISYNGAEKSIEIISKIFLDDLEDAIKKKSGQAIDLFETPTDASKKLVLNYMEANLQVNIDGSKKVYSIVGYERKKDACWVYLEIANVSTCKTIGITNSILYDFSQKQINLLNATVGSDSKSHKLTYPNKEKSFSF